jgi:hypothetical protein
VRNLDAAPMSEEAMTKLRRTARTVASNLRQRRFCAHNSHWWLRRRTLQQEMKAQPKHPHSTP